MSTVTEKKIIKKNIFSIEISFNMAKMKIQNESDLIRQFEHKK